MIMLLLLFAQDGQHHVSNGVATCTHFDTALLKFNQVFVLIQVLISEIMIVE